MLSCEVCEIFKNAFFTDHLRTSASKETVLNKSQEWQALYRSQVNIINQQETHFYNSINI